MLLPMIWAESMSLRKSIAELCANSLDKHAQNIELAYYHNDFRITDDGDGCWELSAMLRLGEHFNADNDPTIGRHGVGFKDATIWLGDTAN
jgi:hypothetical protein